MTTHYQTLPGRTLCNDQSRKFKKLTTMAGEVTCKSCQYFLLSPKHKLDPLIEKFVKGVTI